MTNPTPGDNFDWDAAEADVYDLNAARARRSVPPHPGNSDDDTTTTADVIGDDSDADTLGAGGPVLVDSVAAQRRPRFTLAGIRDAERRPIRPDWLRSRTEFVSNLAYAIGLGGHSVGYHALRTPKYAA
jgi:S-DNA-T family DNA segregation ATPase FtsK/SpoIIIE